MRESVVERYLCNKVKQLGGKALKFQPPGTRGWPDRILLFPGAITIFVETKAPGEELRPLQEKRARELRDLGFIVARLDMQQAVDTFLKEVVP